MSNAISLMREYHVSGSNGSIPFSTAKLENRFLLFRSDSQW